MKKAVVMGLGVMPKGSGISAARFLARQGYAVLVTDLKTRTQLKENVTQLKKFQNIKFVLGQHRESDFKQLDMLVRNPGIKPDSKFLKLVPPEKQTSDIALFLKSLKPGVKVVAVTGTRGKSTTTTLIYEILKAKYGKRVWLGGNIGISPLNFLDQIKNQDIVVLELSSFQLRDLTQPKFHVAVFTNFYPDHLNFYANLQEYLADKQIIFSGQDKTDFALINKDDKTVTASARKFSGKKILYSKAKFKEHGLVGEHNQYNIAAAWKVGEIFKVPAALIKKVVKNFPGVPNRLELIREYKGVKFYNDTTSTHPKATVVALESFPKNKIILISGGNSKNLPLTEMVRTIKKRVKHLITIPGNASAKLPEGIKVKNIQQAVETAWKLAEPGEIILFSPGLTWLPQINEFKRGEKFVELVRQLR